MPGSAESIGLALVVLSVVFACAALIRRWCRPLRKLFIPTAVIGGFLVLGLGPEGLGRITGGSGLPEHQERLSGAALEPAHGLLKRRKLDADVSVQIGDPAKTIIAFAKRRGCAEIVMGNRGRGRVAGLLLGSVTSKVIQLARCPVTVVK